MSVCKQCGQLTFTPDYHDDCERPPRLPSYSDPRVGAVHEAGCAYPHESGTNCPMETDTSDEP